MEKDHLLELLDTIESMNPALIDAMTYLESNEDVLPLGAFTETRDILYHLANFASAYRKDDKKGQNEQIINIKEHFRRGITETYQRTYEHLGSIIFDRYSQYRYRVKVYEKIFFLDKKFARIHKNIEENIAGAKHHRMLGRKLKTLDFNDSDFTKAIGHFKNAYIQLKTVEPDLDKLWGIFNQRVSYLVIFSIILVVYLLVYWSI